MAAMNTPTHRGTTIVDGGIEDSVTYRRSSITILGDTAKLSTYDPDKARMVEVDRLSDVKVDERSDGRIVIEGVSAELVEEARLNPKDARVTWLMTPRGCDQC